MENEKFCKDCVHMRRARSWTEYILWPIKIWVKGDHWICVRLKKEMTIGKPDLVTGIPERYSWVPPTCVSERRHGYVANGCGATGKFWKPKNLKKHLFTLLKQ